MPEKKRKKTTRGSVYLIGAGPGDPGLITVKGKRLIQEADCIIYDFLASKALLAEVKAKELIYVGKSGKQHTLEQEEINRLLVRKAKEGKTVARLKGGDPFIFGRGGEEALLLAGEGIDFEIVPGVSSAYGAAAYAGIPVTHRGLTSTVAFITGHEEPGKQKSDIAWDRISTGAGTLVFLMGVKNLSHIVDNLIKWGRPADTEVALIHWGSTSRQKTITGTLTDIVQKAQKEKLKSPTIIVVGKVVSLRDRLAWFDRKPLFGKTFIVTRTREQASELSGRLIAQGAAVIEIPTIQIVDPPSFSAVDRSIKKLREHYYHWVIFTSANGVERYFARISVKGFDSRICAQARIAVIGPGTADALKRHGLSADLIPSDYRAEGILAEIGEVRGQNILIARARDARDILPETLLTSANSVEVTAVYETVLPPGSMALLHETLKEESVDMVTFTSSSTASNFHTLLDGKFSPGAIKCASIGPVTAKTGRELGFDVAVEAGTYTIDGLVQGIMDYFRAKNTQDLTS